LHAWPWLARSGPARSVSAGTAISEAARRHPWWCTIDGETLLAAEAAQQRAHLVGQFVVLARHGNVVAQQRIVIGSLQIG